MIRAYLKGLIILLLGLPLAFIFSLFNWLLGIIVAGAAGIAGLLYTYYQMPSLAYHAWLADEKEGVLVLLHGNDLRVYPIATEYFRKSNTLVPVDKSKELIFIPDPESTLPVYGLKAKVTNVYIDNPFTIGSKHILIAYDLKRLGLENIAQALDYVKYMEKPEEINAEIQRVKEYINWIDEVLKYRSYAELPDEIKQQINIEESDWEDFRLQLYNEKEKLEQYINDLQHTYRMLVENKKNKPVLRIFGRFYTLKDALGYIGTIININKLMNLYHAMKREAQAKEHSIGDIAKWSILIIAMFVGLIALIVVLGHMPATAVQSPPPVVPQKVILTNTTTTPMG